MTAQYKVASLLYHRTGTKMIVLPVIELEASVQTGSSPVLVFDPRDPDSYSADHLFPGIRQHHVLHQPSRMPGKSLDDTNLDA